VPTTAGIDSGVGALSIVMLPDYCAQQALRADYSRGAFEIRLIDGWRLETIKSRTDPPTDGDKWAEFTRTALSKAMQDIAKATAPLKTDATTHQASGADLANQSGRGIASSAPTVASSNTVISTWLRPGIYPLFSRSVPSWAPAQTACDYGLEFDTHWWDGHLFQRPQAPRYPVENHEFDDRK
jgi:hypothetical protein